MAGAPAAKIGKIEDTVIINFLRYAVCHFSLSACCSFCPVPVPVRWSIQYSYVTVGSAANAARRRDSRRGVPHGRLSWGGCISHRERHERSGLLEASHRIALWMSGARAQACARRKVLCATLPGTEILCRGDIFWQSFVGTGSSAKHTPWTVLWSHQRP